MPPRAKGRTGTSAEPAAAGPHGGQASIRQAYEALGVEHFYASHGYHYTNPHEGQIFAAVSQLLDEVPPSVWLGMEDLAPDTAAGGGINDGDSDADDDGDGPGPDSHVASGSTSSQGPAFAAARRSPPHGSSSPQGPAAAISSGASLTNTFAPCAAALDQLGGLAAAAPDVADAVQSGSAAQPLALPPPVTLRVLDLACGSGEASAAITDWNVRHIVQGEATLGPASLSGAAQRHHHHQSHQQRRGRGGSQTAGALMPYELRITACDPYTGDAYLRRTGRTALRWSFEDIADGCLADWEPDGEAAPPPPVAPAPAAPATPPAHAHNHGKHGQQQQQQQRSQQQQQGRRAAAATAAASTSASLAAATATAAAAATSTAAAAAPPGAHFDLVICSFALHLCDPSRMYGTCTALSVAARWLVVLAPHKRPQLGPELGWALVRDRRVERTHLRLYRSLRAPGAKGS